MSPARVGELAAVLPSRGQPSHRATLRLPFSESQRSLTSVGGCERLREGWGTVQAAGRRTSTGSTRDLQPVLRPVGL